MVLSTCRERCSASSLGLRGFWGPWPYVASNHFISLTAQPHWILVCRTSHTCTSGQSNQLCLLIDTCERGLVRLGILKNEDDPYTAGAAMPEATALQVSLELTSYNIYFPSVAGTGIDTTRPRNSTGQSSSPHPLRLPPASQCLSTSGFVGVFSSA